MRRGAAVALSLLLGGCTTMPRLVATDELEARERRILELEREVGLARAESAELRRKIAELEAALRAAEGASAPPSADAAMAPPAPDVFDEPSPSPPARLAVEESDLADPPTAASGAPDAPSGELTAYESALAALRDGRVDEAERALEQFALSWPASDLADNAWFWLGESRGARGDAAGAIDAYRTAIDRYPEANKIPDVLWKLGVALAASGQQEAARASWTELVRRFPTTAAAEAALVRLGEP